MERIKNLSGRFLSLLLVVALVVSMVGCQNAHDPPVGATDPTVPTTEPVPTVNTEPTLPTEDVQITEPTVPAETEETSPPTEAPTTDPTEAPTEPPVTELTEPTEPEETKAHEHEYTAVDIEMPGCTQDGHTTYACTCGDTYTETIDARGYHTWGEWKVTKEATSSSEGERVRYCTDCGVSQREAIAKLPPEETTPPTTPVVTEPSVTEPTEPPHTHSYYETVVNPTCDEGGYTVHTCACGKSYTDSQTSALGHSYTETVVEPTVSSEGYTVYTCSRCGHSYKDNFVGKLDPPEVTLDYAAAMAYGNQYAADTYGWYIDLSLNFDNAGFNFPTSGSKSGIIERGGQEDLYRMVRKAVDYLHDSLLDRGINMVYVNCCVYEDSTGVVIVYVYYG